MKMNYKGNELELFQHAVNWKNYFGNYIRPHLHGSVLEVGAGIGATTKVLCDGSQKEWCCLEPDEEMFEILSKKIVIKELPSVCTAFQGTINDLPPGKMFDVILYIDVIEHIENDKSELFNAVKYLKSGGKLVILVPAHQELFTPFDKEIGHFRRYDEKSLEDVIPKEMKSISIKYLDSLGTFAVAVNKYILRQNYPSMNQVQFWDKWMIPASRIIDGIFRYRAGKSLLGIWFKM
ncbi:MAG: class I SAM-dependent methyltransferase [Flavisolibacter sp.]|jgi:ubiquinone/menaquinone biosynthesis C-methylase UbiE